MKFRIKDEDGKEYSIEEMIEEKSSENDEETPSLNLSDDEIAALKKLALKSEELLALLDIEKEEHEDEESLDEQFEDADEEEIEEDEEEEEKEEIVDTDEKENDKMKDSVGSIERKTRSNDSIDVQDDIAAAWAKRLNGGNN